MIHGQTCTTQQCYAKTRSPALLQSTMTICMSSVNSRRKLPKRSVVQKYGSRMSTNTTAFERLVKLFWDTCWTCCMKKFRTPIDIVMSSIVPSVFVIIDLTDWRNEGNLIRSSMYE